MGGLLVRQRVCRNSSRSRSQFRMTILLWQYARVRFARRLRIRVSLDPLLLFRGFLGVSEQGVAARQQTVGRALAIDVVALRRQRKLCLGNRAREFAGAVVVFCLLQV